MTTITVNSNKVEIPTSYSIVTLSCFHLNAIYQFLKNHYTIDTWGTFYSKPFLFWYLQRVPKNLIIALVYEKKIVGLITALTLWTIFNSTRIKWAHIHFLCVQKKLRGHGLGKQLMDAMKKKLVKKGLQTVMYGSTQSLTHSFSKIIYHVIPIHLTKLRAIHFLTEDYSPVGDNGGALRLMDVSDIEGVVFLLQKYYRNYAIKPNFTRNFVGCFLTNKKRVVYSFVNKTTPVTEFVSVCCHHNAVDNCELSTAKISFCATYNRSLTEVVQSLVQKLAHYGIDQLIFDNSNHLSLIDLPKFPLNNRYYQSMDGQLLETDVSQMAFLDF